MAFTVYKSSAGSGKTYTLVREYLSLVLTHPENFRHTLAITFTNKAANEMKDRIIRVLKGIGDWKPESPDQQFLPLILELKKVVGLKEDVLAANATRVLSLILHNYSDFAVSTIDSFVHRIIRSFAFDLNIPVNFSVELETDEVLKQVVDILISKAGIEKDLTDFLINFVKSRADEEGNWNIETDLYKIARLLTREDSGAFLEENKHLGISDYLRISRKLRKGMEYFESEVRNFGEKGMAVVKSSGVPLSSFFRGQGGIAAYFKALADLKTDRLTPSATLQNGISEGKWTAQKASRQDCINIAAIQEELQDIYEQVQRFVEANLEEYVLFSEIWKTLYPLAVLDSIYKTLQAFKTENELLLISEFNQLIADIVMEEPVPFIYERVGEKFRHFLVDEFQDTSILQWQNLLPLIDNSLAQGNTNLVVGDAKQAIYRWRSGEVEQFAILPQIYNRKPGQLHAERQKALEDHYNEQELNNNFRSLPGIVAFNNSLFKFTRQYLSEQDAGIYANVEQVAAGSEKGGYVQIDFYEKSNSPADFDAFNLNSILEIISDLQASSYKLDDIAILTRKNDVGGFIADFLLSQGIPVISSESVLLRNSPKIRLLVCVFKLIASPGDTVGAVELIRLLIQLGLLKDQLHQAIIGQGQSSSPSEKGKTHINAFKFLESQGYILNRRKMLSLSLYDLCEYLIRVFGFSDHPDSFIQFFLDVIVDQEKKAVNDINGFLAYWEKKKDSLSIVIPGGINAVRIMSIHKSKGLEFPVVIYPFLNESLRKTYDSVWIHPENETIPELKAAFVGTNKRIEATRFGEKVRREGEKSLLDMVNLLYVAFTRPTDRLYVLAHAPAKSSNAGLSVSSMLMDYVRESEGFSKEILRYRFGEKTAAARTHEMEVSVLPMERVISQDWRGRAMLSYQAPVNWEVEEPEARQEWGNLIHAILARIKTANDLSRVLNDFLFQGMINDKESQVLQEIIGEFLSRPGVKPYFQPGQSVLAETEIITPAGKLLRPDRLVIDQGLVYVIDYKTGAPSDRHQEQMLNYLAVMKQMTLGEPRGVLLYLSQPNPVFID